MSRASIAFAFPVLLVLLAGGCISPQAVAQQDLQRELARRRENREKSAVLYMKAKSEFESGRLDEARAQLRGAVDVDDRNADAWMLLGTVEYRRNRLFDAATAFDRVARLRPTRYEPHFNMGTVLELAGRYDEAIKAYESALRLAPQDVQVMENLARCLVRAGRDRDRAAQLAAEALRSEQRPQWRVWLEPLANGRSNEQGIPNE